jgi:hypothetical protein
MPDAFTRLLALVVESTVFGHDGSGEGLSAPVLNEQNRAACGSFSLKDQVRPSQQASALKVHPVYDPLRQEPRFQALLARLGLSQASLNERSRK